MVVIFKIKQMLHLKQFSSILTDIWKLEADICNQVLNVTSRRMLTLI